MEMELWTPFALGRETTLDFRKVVMVKEFRKIFIVGSPRSGTTWLNRMLAQHPDTVVVPGETNIYHLIYNPFTYLTRLDIKARLQNAKQILRIYGPGPLLMGITYDDIWKGISKCYDIYQDNRASGLHNIIEKARLETLIAQVRTLPDLTETQKAHRLIQVIFEDFFERSEASGDKVFVEKTPIHVKYADRIVQTMPESKIIEIIRDGRDVLVSWEAYAQSNRHFFRSIPKIINRWKEHIEYGKKFQKRDDIKPSIYQMRYENLRVDTRNELTRLFAFCNLACNDEILDHILSKTDIKTVKNKGEGKLVRKGVVGDWKERLNVEKLALVDSLAGSTLEYLGYK